MMDSCSFALQISFELENNSTIYFEASGGTEGDVGADYFLGEALVTVSPKQLGQAKDVDELITLLKNGVIDEWDGTKIFEKSRPFYDEVEDEWYDAIDFVKEIREKITNMDQILTIGIEGQEENRWNECYLQEFIYSLKTKKYIGAINGDESEYSGKLRFSDLDSCDIYEGVLDDYLPEVDLYGDKE